MDERRSATQAIVGGGALVLDHDRALLDIVAERERSRARARSAAHVIRVAAGPWSAEAEAETARGGIGLFVLDGLLIRRVGVSGGFGAELLGPGDVMRPWQHDGEDGELLPVQTTWLAVAPTLLAVLDVGWAARMAAWPAVTCELVGRALERSRRLATLLAISQHRRLDVRLRLLLWALADRFGVVRPDGVHLELPLTHEALACLAVARRPSVSTALGRLTKAGALRRQRRHIVLIGEPPGSDELDEATEERGRTALAASGRR